MKENTPKQMKLSNETLELIEQFASTFVTPEARGGIEIGAIHVLTSPEILSSCGLVKQEWVSVEEWEIQEGINVMGGHSVDGWVCEIFNVAGKWYNTWDWEVPCYPTHIQLKPNPPKK